MNPWAFIVIAVGLLLIIMGVKGTQHQVTGALVGHPTGGGTITTTAARTTTPPGFRNVTVL